MIETRSNKGSRALTRLTKLLLSASAEGYHPAQLSRGNRNSSTGYEINLDSLLMSFEGTDPL